jgi:hypothetical protein
MAAVRFGCAAAAALANVIVVKALVKYTTAAVVDAV